jgi:hypothetical protein
MIKIIKKLFTRKKYFVTQEWMGKVFYYAENDTWHPHRKNAKILSRKPKWCKNILHKIHEI